MVRAKFYVERNDKWDDENNHVVLRAVTSGSRENETFWKYTPNGMVDMTIKNDIASRQFVLGVEFYLDFTEVEKE